MCDNNFYISNDNSSEVQENTDSNLSQIRDLIDVAGDLAGASKLLMEEYKKSYGKKEEED